eukprot:6629623-Prymnesium_polylepis.1
MLRLALKHALPNNLQRLLQLRFLEGLAWQLAVRHLGHQCLVPLDHVTERKVGARRSDRSGGVRLRRLERCAERVGVVVCRTLEHLSGAGCLDIDKAVAEDVHEVD